MAQAPPSCPRCGYDQSGVVASWTDACPLTGVCSECGLAFEWLDVMRPERLRVPGFYEHEQGVAPRAAWKTLTWTARPWRFWSRLRLEHPVRLRRALLWLVLFLVAFQLLHAASVIAERPWRNAQLKVMPPMPGMPMPGLWDGVIAECLAPLTRRDMFSWWVGLARPGGGGARGPLVNPAPQWVGSWALGGPLSGLAPGWRNWTLFAMGMVCFWLALPAMLLCLPQSRSRAKVRWQHVARATLYGAAWLVLLGALRLADECWQWLLRLTGGDWTGVRVAWQQLSWQSGSGDLWRAVVRHQGLVGSALALWLAWWWWCALKRGWRIQQPVAVWLATVIPAALIALMVLTVVSPFGVGGFVDGLMQGRRFPR